MAETDELDFLFERTRPAKRRQAIRKGLAYLRDVNRKRITQQRNADGSSYTPRKNKRRKRKMLTGFRRLLRTRNVTGDRGYLSYSGASSLALIHHLGRVDQQGLKMPERELIGANDDDWQAAIDIMIEALLSE